MVEICSLTQIAALSLYKSVSIQHGGSCSAACAHADPHQNEAVSDAIIVQLRLLLDYEGLHIARSPWESTVAS